MTELEKIIAEMTADSGTKRFSMREIFELGGRKWPPGDYAIKIIEQDGKNIPHVYRVR